MDQTVEFHNVLEHINTHQIQYIPNIFLQIEVLQIQMEFMVSH